MTENPRCPGARLVALANGEMTWSDTEEWRLETEARYVNLLDDWHASQYLLEVAKRGPGAADQLEAKMRELAA